MFRAAILAALVSVCSFAANESRANERCKALDPETLNRLGARSVLFLLTDRGWQEVPATGLRIGEFDRDKLSFIYVPKKGDAPHKQFIAVKTASFGTAENMIALRRHHSNFGAAHSGVYREYHEGRTEQAPSLRIYHRWGSGNRSDQPTSSRNSFAFGDPKPAGVRRLLTISFDTSEDRVTCVPFRVGPNLVASMDEDGSGELQLRSSFMVEVSEVKVLSGEAGRTFVVTGGASRQ